VSADRVLGGQRAGRWHPLIRVVLYFIAMAAVNRIAFAGVATLLPGIPDWLLDLLEGGVYLGGMLVLSWVFIHYLDRQPLVTLGLHSQGSLLQFAIGLGLGAGLMGLIFATMVAAGWLAAEAVRPALLPFFASALSWAALSFVEELTFRGYILQGLAKVWVMPVAVVASSLLFGMVHLIDPNVQLLAILNICVAGLFFAVAYLVTRSLWLPAGIHVGWNLAEIHVLGLPGSGHTEPSLLYSTVSGPALVTGGAFGPEGGLVGLAGWLLGIALLLGYWVALGRRAHAPSRRSLY
jgi:membrane protease YdiL (CAAX protease family)